MSSKNECNCLVMGFLRNKRFYPMKEKTINFVHYTADSKAAKASRADVSSIDSASNKARTLLIAIFMFLFIIQFNLSQIGCLGLCQISICFDLFE